MLAIEPQGVGACLSSAYDFAIYVLEGACDKAMDLTIAINDNGGVQVANVVTCVTIPWINLRVSLVRINKGAPSINN